MACTLVVPTLNFSPRDLPIARTSFIFIFKNPVMLNIMASGDLRAAGKCVLLDSSLPFGPQDNVPHAKLLKSPTLTQQQNKPAPEKRQARSPGLHTISRTQSDLPKLVPARAKKVMICSRPKFRYNCPQKALCLLAACLVGSIRNNNNMLWDITF